MLKWYDGGWYIIHQPNIFSPHFESLSFVVKQFVLTWIIKSPVFAWKINQNVRCSGVMHATLIDKCASDAPSATAIDSWFRKSLLGIFLARNSRHCVIFRVAKNMRITIMSHICIYLLCKIKSILIIIKLRLL